MNKEKKNVEELLLKLENEKITISKSISELLTEKNGVVLFPIGEISKIIVGNGGDPLTTFYKF